MDTHAAAAHGTEAHHPHPKYFVVWFVLLVFTVLEVLVGITQWPLIVKAPLLVGMALFKAVVVAGWFMHLKFEKKGMWIVAAAPLIFGVILAIGAYPDSEHSTDAKKQGGLPVREKHE